MIYIVRYKLLKTVSGSYVKKFTLNMTSGQWTKQSIVK